MAKRDMMDYLDAYSEIYNARHNINADVIGDCFCSMKSDAELESFLHAFPYALSVADSRSSIRITAPHLSVSDSVRLPAFSIALQEFFYKDYLYPEDRYSQDEKRRITELENWLANRCGSQRSAISHWKSGKRIPSKYRWWALAINAFELDYWYIHPYLDMIGTYVDFSILDDILLFYALCTGKTMQETYVLLLQYDRIETKKLFINNANTS